MEKIEFARELRRNATYPERLLWQLLRGRALEGHRFRRQRPIGPYFVDFVCVERRVVVELDGGQHGRERTQPDVERTRFLEREGFRVVRFWNDEVMSNREGVVEAIVRALQLPPPPLLVQKKSAVVRPFRAR